MNKITCPYFIRCGRTHNKFTLLCEGVITGGTERRLFNSFQERNKWIDKNCTKAGVCPLQAVINERYKISLDNDILL